MANIPNTNSKLTWVKAMSRGQCFPLDATEVWTNYDDAKAYAESDPTAYFGQTLKVINTSIINEGTDDEKTVCIVSTYVITTDDKGAVKLVELADAEDTSTKDAVVLAEAQTYVDTAISSIQDDYYTKAEVDDAVDEAIAAIPEVEAIPDSEILALFSS